MSSLVTEILHSSGKLAKENIVTKIDSLKKKVEDIKLEVHESLSSRYVDFIPQYVKLEKFIRKLNNMTNDYESLCNQVEKEVKPQMSDTVAELHDVLEDLKKIKKLKSAVSNLISLHEYLEAARRSLLQSIYLNAAENLLKFDTLYQSINFEQEHKDIEIYEQLRTEFYVCKEEIIYNLQKIWHEKIEINNNFEGKNKNMHVTLTINKETEENEIDFLASLHMLKNLKPLLKEFGKKFLNLICENVLLKNTKIETDYLNKKRTLTVIVINEEYFETSRAFELLLEVFKFLNLAFFNLPFTLNEEQANIFTIMMEFGNIIGDEFCTLVVEKSLKSIIPKQSKHLTAFHNQIEAATNFHNSLLEYGFLTNDNKLQEFLFHVDTLPVNKMAQEFLVQARSLMKESLSNTVLIDVTADKTDVDDRINDINAKNCLSDQTFAFPCCQISLAVKNLVNLLHEVMLEAKNLGLAYAPKLYFVARNICELYCSVVPTYHKENIENIPQQTALFHNNCMYIAHCLLTLGIAYENSLKLNFPLTFVDLVPEIRKLGVEAFLSQMRHQRQLLLQLLQENQVFQNIACDDVVIKADRSIRQCLCQLQLLKKVWADVLPLEVYFKSIGTLFNTCLEEIILHVMSMEDIAAETASRLDSLFDFLLKQSPDLFKVTSINKSDYIHLYVRRWFKFQELQLVLNASMREIVNRWASGKGPLATYFTADEVKHLIRALFQNTERRAEALGKIK